MRRVQTLPSRSHDVLRLHYQTHSPFARKVLVFAFEAGLSDRLEVIHQETSPTKPNEEVFAINPLGKVPVLDLGNAGALFDSDVICAYLDTLHPRDPLYPKSGGRRWRALEWQAVAQGIAEAGIAVRWEDVRRPVEFRYPPFRDGQALKLSQSYAWLNQSLKKGDDLHAGHIAVATALDWIEFRGLPSFRAYARLGEWLDQFKARPSMTATPLSGDTIDS